MPLLLAIDTTAKPVSCALMRDDTILGSYYANTGLTHSQTLMPMIEHLLATAGVSVNDLDALAVNAGPGSFTGVRIGVSAVKGIAFSRNLPCVSVSTLEAMAEQIPATPDSLICCAMDARCQQVYTALFSKNEAGETVRLMEDNAISLDDLKEKLKKCEKSIILVGDGSHLCYTTLRDEIPHLILAPASVRYQNAAATATVAMRKLQKKETVPAESLLPVYLRLPQAERELHQRQAMKNKTE